MLTLHRYHRCCLPIFLVALTASPPCLSSQSPRLVKDINTLSPANPSSSPKEFAKIGILSVFVAATTSTGSELFSTLGTTQSTVLIKDINPGAGNGWPMELTVMGKYIYFSADDGVSGRELWRTDGTAAGTVRVLDCKPGKRSGNPSRLTAIGSTLYFAADNGVNGMEVWMTDGTTKGTTMLDVLKGTEGSLPRQFLALGKLVLFVAWDGRLGTAGLELWKTDGTLAGTALVKDIYPGVTSSRPGSFAVLGNRAYFTATDSAFDAELWTTDGTTGGTTRLVDINPGPRGSSPMFLTRLGKQIFFTATTLTAGTELWRTDGTAKGTVLVSDISTGSRSSYPSVLTVMGSDLYFSADDGISGGELWKSNGTKAGTMLVKDIRAGTATSAPRELTPVNGNLFFQATDAKHGTELWRSNGTATGTTLIKDIRLGLPGAGPDWISPALPGMVIFQADDGKHGRELWMSNGTLAGTVLVKDLNPSRASGTLNSSPIHLTDFLGKLFFVADDGLTGKELWVSDGTALGTHLVKDIRLGGRGSSPAPGSKPTFIRNYFLCLGSYLYFVADDGVSGLELWRTDGSAKGTIRLTDMNYGRLPSQPYNLVAYKGKVYFNAFSNGATLGMWSTNGTVKGTQQVNWGSQVGVPTRMAKVGGTLFFSGGNAQTGNELWKTDGTLQGTVLVKDILIGTGSSVPGAVFGIVDFGGLAVFTATDKVGLAGTLWRSDGTPGGTYRIAPYGPAMYGFRPSYLKVVGNSLFFFGITKADGFEPWKSDGTLAGTSLLKNIGPGAASSQVAFGMTDSASMGNRWYFKAHDGVNGFALWRSDGTRTGTFLLKDPIAGLKGSGPISITASGSRQVFFACESSAGRELWVTDGSSKGTKQVADLFPGTRGAAPWDLVLAGGKIYFSALHPIAGRELFVHDLGASSKTFGLACGGKSAFLQGEDPVLGKTMTIRGERAGKGNVTINLIGLGSRSPMELRPGCLLYVDLFKPMVIIQPFVVKADTWNVQVLIPNDPRLAGAQLVGQSIYFTATSSLQVSNGLHIGLGR